MPNTVPAADPGLPSTCLDNELVRLGRELEAVQAARDAFEASGSNEDDPNYEAHRKVRERIAASPATGFAGLFVKARAAELAHKYDTDASSEKLGSFVSLADSLIRNLKAIEARMATCPVLGMAREAERILPASNRLNKNKPHLWELAYDHLTDRLSDIEKEACDYRARSACGATLQIFVIDTEIETVFANDKDADRSTQRQIERGLYSVASAIEALSGERLPACRGYYQTSGLDPFGVMERALAGEDTPPAETSEMQEGAS